MTCHDYLMDERGFVTGSVCSGFVPVVCLPCIESLQKIDAYHTNLLPPPPTNFHAIEPDESAVEAGETGEVIATASNWDKRNNTEFGCFDTGCIAELTRVNRYVVLEAHAAPFWYWLPKPE